MNTAFDVLVIGGGVAGENAADLASRGGLRVGLVEHELVGGECSYWACVPSKMLLRPGQALEQIRRVPGAREAVNGDIDVEQALKARDDIVGSWNDQGQVEWLESVEVTLIRGHGRLAGIRQVEVTGPEGEVTGYEVGKAVALATGSKASFPPIEGLHEARIWDSRTATSAKHVPRRLLVVGGGAVGCEMAQAWKWLGAEEVTVIERFGHLLSQEEPFAGAEVAAAFSEMGIVVHTSAEAKSVDRKGVDGPVVARVKLSDDSEIEIEADEVLVATGRRPNTDDLGVETVGLEPGKSVEVDEHLLAKEVGGGWLYAVGDVNGRALLTHSAKYQGRIAGAHIAGLATTAWGDTVAPPRVAFTSPEVAAVGLTEAAARQRGVDVRTVKYDIGKLSAAVNVGEGYSGTCQLVVDVSSGTIVGATFVGPRTGELIHAATVAIVGKVPLQTLWHAIPSFPTLSEIWLRLLEAYRDKYEVQFS
jgi:dihydrolipoamide dehydrogenase